MIPTSVDYSDPNELTKHIVKGVTICYAIIKVIFDVIVEVLLGRPLFGTTLTVFMPTTILLVLSQMLRLFGQDHLEMVNLTLLLVLFKGSTAAQTAAVGKTLLKGNFTNNHPPPS